MEKNKIGKNTEGKMGRRVWKFNRDSRKKIAEKNSEDRMSRSSQEQLTILDKRLGKGVGALKERARLQKQIAG